MKKVKFWHILLSLTFAVVASGGISLPIVKNLYQQALSTTQEDVEKIYQDLNQALVGNDMVELQKLLADGFELVTSQGQTLSKQEWIRQIQLGKIRYTQFSENEIQAVGRNKADVSSVMFAEILTDHDVWKAHFRLEIIRKGQNIQIQRMVAKSVCEMGKNGLFEQNCRGAE